MSILVIGGAGLLGGHLIKEGTRRGHEMTGTYRNHPVQGMIHCDLENLKQAEALLERVAPDVVIHSAGWTHVDGCEKDPVRAMKENAEQPERLAEISHRQGIRFVYVSSAYVFDGRGGPYSVNDEPNPINNYGRSKLAGERTVSRATGGNALLPRVIWLYGWERQKKNYAYQVLNAMKSGREIGVPGDQWGNPTYAGDAAVMLFEILNKGVNGVMNLVNQPCCSRSDWTNHLIHGFASCGIKESEGFERREVESNADSSRATRPLKACLAFDTRFKTVLCPEKQNPYLEMVDYDSSDSGFLPQPR